MKYQSTFGITLWCTLLGNNSATRVVVDPSISFDPSRLQKVLIKRSEPVNTVQAPSQPKESVKAKQDSKKSSVPAKASFFKNAAPKMSISKPEPVLICIHELDFLYGRKEYCGAR